MASHAPDFRFRSSCGAGIRLNATRTTATRVDNKGSIVLSHAPIETGWIYEVKADNCQIHLGICDWELENGEVPRSCRPDNMDNPLLGMNHDPGNGFQKAVICDVGRPGTAFYNGMDGTGCKVTSDKVQWPDKLDSESTIGVMLDKKWTLHLYIDDKHKGVFATGVPEFKWYAFWDLGTSCQEAKVEPVRQPQ